MNDMNASHQTVDAAAVAAGRDSLQKALDSMVTALDGHREEIPDNSAPARAIRGIREDVIGLRAKLAEDRLLRLGIVGQVKAGKSSLLNLLLFDGREVLPKAATPMTASLTHIMKSDRDEIEVEYYTKKDWAEIAEHAREYQHAKAVPDFVSASHELVAMARQRGLQVGQYLDKNHVEPVTLPRLNAELARLVGAEGKLTPLVKSVTIRCGQGVPDLDIVDTPGINDPIGSRSRQAEKLLVSCDAVLLLSYSGQFMDNVDVQFFEQRLPEEGISHRLIIGSKFDSALIDVATKYRGDLQSAKDDTEQHLKHHAADAIEQLSDHESEDMAADEIIFVSAMSSALAATPYSDWRDEERELFARIRRAYPDWFDEPDARGTTITAETKATLADLGNRDAVTERLDAIRRNKEQIVFASNRDKVDEKRAAAIKEAEGLIEDLDKYKKDVNEKEVEQIEQEIKAGERLMARLSVRLEDAWSIRIDRKSQGLFKIRREIRAEAKEARNAVKGAVSVEQGYKEKKSKKGAGLLGVGWLMRKLIGESDYETYREPYEKKVLDATAVEDAVNDMQDFLRDSLTDLCEKMFDPEFEEKAANELRGIVSIETSSDLAEAWDIDVLWRAVRDAVSKVSEDARAKLDADQIIAASATDFEGLGAEEGRRRGREIVKRIVDRGVEWIDEAKDELDRVAAEAKRTLVPAALQELRDSQERLKKDIKDREFKTQRINDAVKEIEECRSSLRSAG